MYNIYVEEKKKKELEDRKKEELRLLRYKQKFESKKQQKLFDLYHRTNPYYV